MDKDVIKALRATIITLPAEEYQRSQDLLLTASTMLEKANKDVREHRILYEGARKEAAMLLEQNQQLRYLVDVMCGYINDSLETFEQMYECDEGCFTYERMADYVIIARFMQSYKGRACIADRVDKRMRELPFGE